MHSYSIIGNGNLASFLLHRLQSAGNWKAEGLWCRNVQHAENLLNKFNLTRYTQLYDIPDKEDHYCFLAVSDQAIAEIAAHLQFKKTILVHHSGTTPISAIAGAAVQHAVIWPLYSIVQPLQAVPEDVPLLFACGQKETEGKLYPLLNALSTQYYPVTEGQRKDLHLCAVLCNNFTHHLMVISREICQTNELPFKLLQPIIKQTLRRIDDAEEIKPLQSGPAVRRDDNTIGMHLELLKDHPEWQAVYQSLTRSIRKMYSRSEE